MKTEFRIYVALAVLAVLGIGLYFTRQSDKKKAAEHSPIAASADLPSIGVPKDDVEKITKIEIKNADKSNVVLEKKGEDWQVVQPVQAKANASNVRSLLDNLKELKIKETIDRTTATYAQYELDDAKAVHVVAYKGDEKAIDLYFGKSGSRGQMVRIGGKDGVYIAGGYSSYLYTREVKNWRETSVLKFEDTNAVSVEIENKNGKLSFSKNDDKWSASYAKRTKGGTLEKGGKWEKFDENKIKDMLRAYKSLNAEDFAEANADTGLDKAVEHGGVVRIKLKDGAGDYTVKVGKVAKGTSRYAIREGGDGVVVVLSSWSADWATADKSKFEKPEDKKDKDKDKDKDKNKKDDHDHDDLEPPIGDD